MNSQVKQDAKLIETLGGPTKVAVLLDFALPHGVQRVSNWRTRGIPAKVKLDHPDLFINQTLEAA